MEATARPEPNAEWLAMVQAREESRQFLDWENTDLLRDCMSIIVNPPSTMLAEASPPERDFPLRRIKIWAT